MTAATKNTTFWDVKPSCLVDRYHRFGGICHLDSTIAVGVCGRIIIESISGNIWWHSTGSISMAQNRAAGSCEQGTIPPTQLIENGATCEISLICIRNFSIVSEYKKHNTTLRKQFVFVALCCVLYNRWRWKKSLYISVIFRTVWSLTKISWDVTPVVR